MARPPPSHDNMRWVLIVEVIIMVVMVMVVMVMIMMVMIATPLLPA